MIKAGHVVVYVYEKDYLYLQTGIVLKEGFPKHHTNEILLVEFRDHACWCYRDSLRIKGECTKLERLIYGV